MDKKILEKEIQQIGVDCGRHDWDGYQADPITQDTVHATINLISLLPEWMGMPKIILGTTGDIFLEWKVGENFVQLSTGESGKLFYYIVLDRQVFCEKVENFKLTLSKELLILISKCLPHESHRKSKEKTLPTAMI